MKTLDFETYADEKSRLCGSLPLSGTLEVTRHCNLSCRHCYMCDYRPGETEMTTDEVCEVLDQIAEAGCLRLLITGGEPLLRKDFPEIWRYAKQKGLLLTLFTNATLVDEAMAELLAEYPPMLLEFTLYGASERAYADICGDRSAFGRMLQGIDRLRAICPHINAKTIVMPSNREELQKMADICHARDIPFSFETDIFPRLDGDCSPFDEAFEPDEAARLIADSELHRNLYAVERDKDEQKAPPEELSRADYLVVCRAGERSFYVDPYGHLVLCSLLREPSYALRSGRFMEGWQQLVKGLREARREKPLACARCSDMRFCVPCAGRSLLETGSPWNIAPRLCAVSKARGRMFRKDKEQEMAENV